MFDKLVIKVNTVDTKIPNTSEQILKTWYNFEKQGLEKKTEDADEKIPNTIGNTFGLVKKTD